MGSLILQQGLQEQAQAGSLAPSRLLNLQVSRAFSSTTAKLEGASMHACIQVCVIAEAQENGQVTAESTSLLQVEESQPTARRVLRKRRGDAIQKAVAVENAGLDPQAQGEGVATRLRKQKSAIPSQPSAADGVRN